VVVNRLSGDGVGSEWRCIKRQLAGPDALHSAAADVDQGWYGRILARRDFASEAACGCLAIGSGVLRLLRVILHE
jgi:hypothetical protein